ncbi:hypothetical protein [Edaphobacter bradus]|uniref:hypothetical protein n=1 Tax=Edaphobacter bradus TaxID=2259016 RepID=UPI0021E0133D|nr:hypothetical protein [Edaphobacter bradus]
MRTFVVCCSLLLGPVSVLAQSHPEMVAEVSVTTPKTGMTAQWETGRKQHSAFHASQKDIWNIFVWEIMTGERSGSYVSVSPGHHWSDLDARQAFDKLDGPDVAKNILPYSTSTTLSYAVLRDDLSLTKPPATPAPLRSVTYYSVIPAHVNDFTDAVKKINAGIQKTNWPAKPSRWAQLAYSGESPSFAQIVDRATWADLEPPEKTLTDALKEAYGDDGPKLLDQVRHSCSKIYSELQVYRADLSYVAK